jgi:cation transport ATPase
MVIAYERVFKSIISSEPVAAPQRADCSACAGRNRLAPAAALCLAHAAERAADSRECDVVQEVSELTGQGMIGNVAECQVRVASRKHLGAKLIDKLDKVQISRGDRRALHPKRAESRISAEGFTRHLRATKISDRPRPATQRTRSNA